MDVFAEFPSTLAASTAEPGVLYRIPRTLLFASGDASVAFGAARSAMDAFFELAGVKTPRASAGLLREQSMIQVDVGRAEADLRSWRIRLEQFGRDLETEPERIREFYTVRATRIEPVGQYAVQLVFSDGHDTGIYSWDLLYDYGVRQDEMWQRYLRRLQEAGASREASPMVESRVCCACPVRYSMRAEARVSSSDAVSSAPVIAMTGPAPEPSIGLTRSNDVPTRQPSTRHPWRRPIAASASRPASASASRYSLNTCASEATSVSTPTMVASLRSPALRA